MLNTGKIYLHKILGNTLGRTLHVGRCGSKIYLHKITREYFVEHWEYLFTPNTGKYFV